MEAILEEDIKKENEIKWEKFLPRMFIRVLLVEADDSTRHVITALLKKCSYRVAAVPDGLKAWETLKDKSENIDLILTEVDLPSISGFSLLTLVMGHDTCKKIPVIMMSSHDSISMVFKCLLKGAVDFLMKPIRKNELKNLWQHVWRRSLMNDDRECQNQKLAQKNYEAVSENGTTSIHSTDGVVCLEKNKECSEKGSDAQSSSTKPDTEAESACVPNQSVCPYYRIPSPFTREDKKFGIVGKRESTLPVEISVMPDHEVIPQKESIISRNLSIKVGHPMKQMNEGDLQASNSSKDEIMDHNFEHDIKKRKKDKHSSQALDLIGAINKQISGNKGYTSMTGDTSRGYILSSSSSCDACNSNDMLQLGLSLKRTLANGCEHKQIDEEHRLNHSKDSPFSRYNNKICQAPSLSPPNSNNDHKEYSSGTSGKSLSSYGGAIHTNSSQKTRVTSESNQDNVNCMSSCHITEDKTNVPCPRLGLVTVCVHGAGTSFDASSSSGYASLINPTFHAESVFPQWTNSFRHHEGICLDPSQIDFSCDQNVDMMNYQMSQEDHMVKFTENMKHSSSTEGCSEHDRTCDHRKSHVDNSEYGSVCDASNENITITSGSVPTGKNKNGIPFDSTDGELVYECTRMSQREAALNKFRLKRKDRCFEKKVRYQSRKKLAEQRPRVKGQFVRQVKPDPPDPPPQKIACFSQKTEFGTSLS